MVASYFFGEVPGEPVGTAYESRRAVQEARVHQLPQQGIAGNRREGCASIVMSGGYDTDEDFGHEIYYTGRGGQDPRNRRGPHVADQDLALNDNAALVRSQETGRPIRVVRGASHPGSFSPASGYRYDGLYRVANHYSLVHPGDGFVRWMFHLVQLTGAEASEYTPSQNTGVNARVFFDHDLGSGTGLEVGVPVETLVGPIDSVFEAAPQVEFPVGQEAPDRVLVTTQRVVRDSRVAVAVKALYENHCQICDTAVMTRVGRYAEGAHIRPLGPPHQGADIMDNILCLCPNHHAAFDRGGVIITDDLRVVDRSGHVLGVLTMRGRHQINVENIRYHRENHLIP